MYKIVTQTRIIENESMCPCVPIYRKFSEKMADNLLESYNKEIRDNFIIKYKHGVPNNEPAASMFVDKTDLQTIYETSSFEERQTVEEKLISEKKIIAVKRSRIDFIKEMEIWLKTIESKDTQRNYRSRITIHFMKFCKEYSLDPVMFTPEKAREFSCWLNNNKVSNPTKRSIIIACKQLYKTLWENHEIPIETNPFASKSLISRKIKREKPLYIPNQTDVDKFLDYIYERNKIVYTAIKLIVKYGMRIGAFEEMKIRRYKAVTVSKSSNHSFIFDNEDITLLTAHPLNGLTAERLGNMVNYHLEQAYNNGITKERYSVHDFRHFFAVEFYKKTNDLIELSKRLGHKHFHTTEVYLESLKKESQ